MLRHYSQFSLRDLQPAAQGGEGGGVKRDFKNEVVVDFVCFYSIRMSRSDNAIKIH